nr:S8 family serine peptidase [Calditrichia bacterium]
MAKLFCKILFLGCFLAAGTLLGQSKITPSLDDRIGAAMENGEMVEALVFLADQFDIRALDRQLYREKASPRERAYRVITALQSKAQETQPILMTFLENQAALGLEAVERYWIANILVIRANPALIYALSERDEVEFLDIVHKPQIEDGYPDPEQPDSPMIPGGSELGLRLVKADSMWALGYDGTGRLVMNYDSGVDGNHPALAGRWLGLRVPTDQAWNGAGNFPADGNGHGTHTMGTITGMSPSTSDTVGMAPGAEWIAADFDVSIVGAFQWAMNPDGDPNTIADMPDVVSNSWGVDPTGGCLTNTYGNILSAVEASGIAVVFSAGNSGPGTQTITGPKNINIDLVNTFATANLRGADPSLPYNAGSSRGPSGCGGSGPLLIKPEAGAPGTSVRSSIPGGGYANFTGTSMACPHVAGAVTLLKQALPDRTGHELKMALYLTARETPADLAGNDPGEPIGEESGEDNNYGRGIIDVYAAFLSFASPAAPGNLVAYSDYRTPDGMSLTWENPTNLANGDTLLPGDYQVIIERDGVVVDSLPGGSNTYTDGGLNDGQAYSYAVHARTLANALNGESSQTRWICGGAPEPRGVSRFFLS